MKKSFICIALVASVINANSQTNSQIQNSEPCGTKAPSAEWEQWFQSKIAERKANIPYGKNASQIYTIPVIIHIIHNNDVINTLSQEQVNSQIYSLDDDFAGVGVNSEKYPPTNPAPSGWPSILPYTGISFCLAAQDTNGMRLSEYGIDRINWSTKPWIDPHSFLDQTELIAYFNNVIKPQSIWDPKKYLNIWVASLSRTRLLGQATFPIGSTLDGINSNLETDSTSGVILDYRAFGNIGTATSPYNLGRTATHEIGHWLGLRHIWGDEFCGDDYCDDTPKQYKENFGCPNFPETSLFCLSGSDGDMFMNFMDYTNDSCKYMFTFDQTDRIQTAMAYGTFRSQLKNSPACDNPKPDLIILKESLSTPTINAGSSLTTYHRVKNQGGGNASSSITAIWLSKDQYFDAQTDINLAADVSVPALISGQTSNLFSKNITIPPNTASGQWYIMLGCDADDAHPIAESDESNNQRFIPITINNTSINCTTPNTTITPSTVWQNASSSHAINNYKIYRVPLLSGNVYTFKTGCGNGATANYDTYLELYKSNCATIKTNDDSCESTRSAISLTANYTGDAYLKVSGYGGTGGNFTLAYQYHTCTGWYTSPSSQSFTSSADSSSFTTYTSSGGGCGFYAINNDTSWIKNITFPGNGVVKYKVLANSGSARTGSISIKDVNNVVQATYYITQEEGGCLTCPSSNYNITPATYWLTHTSRHGTNECKIYRIYVTSGNVYTFKTGCGDGSTADYDTYLELYNNSCNLLKSNDDSCSSHRSALFWKADYDGYIYLKVSGYRGAGGHYSLAYNYHTCSGWAVNPTFANYNSSLNTDSFYVTITTNTSGCRFSAHSNNYWIKNLRAGGIGEMLYDVDFNPDAPRSGTISIIVDNITVLTFTVYQEGTTCTSCPSADLLLNPTTSWQNTSSSHQLNGCKLYKIPVTTGRIYTFKTGCDDGASADYDTYLILYNNNCTSIATDDDGCYPQSIINWASTFNGYVYLKVLGYHNLYSGIFSLAYKYSSCTIPSQPSIISGNLNVCENSSQTYSINPDANTNDFTWNLPPYWSGSSLTNSITTIPGSSGGIISVSANNDCGSSPIRTLSITVNPIPEKPGNITGSTEICEGSQQSYTINSIANATDYTWILPSGWIGSSSTTSINTTPANASGTISVSANNLCGNSSPQTSFVHVNPLPSQVANIYGSTSICQESTTDYSINTILDAVDYIWSYPVGWTLNSGQGTTLINVKVGANSGQVCVVPLNDCGNSSEVCTNVNVNRPVGAVNIVGPSSPSVNSVVSYSASASNATIYNWSFPSGWIVNSGSGTSTINVLVGTNSGLVCLTPSNSCGDGVQDCLSIITGLSHQGNSNNINIYPNPNTGQFIIDMDLAKSGNLKINITDILGRNILTQTTYVTSSKNKIPIQLSGIANGSYVVNLEFNGDLYKKKIVVTK